MEQPKPKMDKPQTRFGLGVIVTILGALFCIIPLAVDYVHNLPQKPVIFYLISLALLLFGLYIFLTMKIYKIRYASQNIFAMPVSSDGKDLNTAFSRLRNQTNSKHGSFTPYEAKLQLLFFSILSLVSLAFLFLKTLNTFEPPNKDNIIILLYMTPLLGVVFALQNLSYKLRLAVDNAFMYVGILILISIPIQIYFMLSAQVDLEKIIKNESIALIVGCLLIYSNFKKQKETKKLMESKGKDWVAQNLKVADPEADSEDEQ